MGTVLLFPLKRRDHYTTWTIMDTNQGYAIVDGDGNVVDSTTYYSFTVAKRRYDVMVNEEMQAEEQK